MLYIFNSGRNGKPILKANGTGFTNGLRLLLYINQEDYVATFSHDAGAKIAVHPQSEPPLAGQLGVAIPPGTNALISFKKQITDDQTKRGCSDVSYAYCVHNRFYERLQNNCNCKANSSYQPCTDQLLNFCSFNQLCCYFVQYFARLTTPCMPACRSAIYEIVSTSYSKYPAAYFHTISMSQL